MTNSEFRPCVLIPVYNHGATMGATVAAVARMDLPIYVIDDGSDPWTRAALAHIAAECPSVRLTRLERNSGKGSAVMAGMQRALADDMTHALQVDADGQHDIADIPAFLARGAACPDAVVCGDPLFDASAPKARLYGRYLTRFWVWVETLSFGVRDAMCGFRLYPLRATVDVIERGILPPRMDFDIAVVVRLVWRGVPVENVATRVVYPSGGLSHFDMLRDNLRISRTHSRLVCGMFLRLPLLLWRKAAAAGEAGMTHWSRIAERGSACGLQFIGLCYRLLGERTARAFLVPVVIYFLLTGVQSRRASMQYFARLRACAGAAAGVPDPGWRTSFRHMMAFGESALHKLSAWLGDIDPADVAFPAQAQFARLVADGKGALLVGAHLGNLEMTRALAAASRVTTVNAVVYTNHARRFQRLLARANADYSVNLIEVTDFGPDTAIILSEKIERGEVLVIVGDRTPPAQNGRVCTVDFLGAPAAFPQGPFILAALLQCPVYLFLCVRQQDGYRIHLEALAQRIELPRMDRERALRVHVQRYAHRLQEYCLSNPYQWFNFYDFWSAGILARDIAPHAKQPAAEAHAHEQ